MVGGSPYNQAEGMKIKKRWLFKMQISFKTPDKSDPQKEQNEAIVELLEISDTTREWFPFLNNIIYMYSPKFVTLHKAEGQNQYYTLARRTHNVLYCVSQRIFGKRSLCLHQLLTPVPQPSYTE